jgi:polar amino acid transport system substrate-binding protein
MLQTIRLYICLFGSVFASMGLMADELTVGVETTEYYPQYQYENGNYQGFARDVIDLFASKNGHSVSYKAYPIKRLLSVYLAGEVDLKYPDNAFWASDAKATHKVVYSDPVVNFIDGTLVLPANKDKGIGDKFRLGTIAGFTPFDYLDKIGDGSVKVTENNNLDALVKQVESGRVEGAYFNVAVAMYHLREVMKKPELMVFDASLPHTRSAYAISSIKRPDIVEQFNAFLKSSSAEIQALKDKYQVEAGIN